MVYCPLCFWHQAVRGLSTDADAVNECGFGNLCNIRYIDRTFVQAPPMPLTSLLAYSFSSHMGFETICYAQLDSHRCFAYNPLVDMTLCHLNGFRVFLLFCNMRRCMWLHMDAYGCIRMHIETVSSDFHWLPLVSEGFEAIWAWRVAGLWQLVASCDARVLHL